jgi:hypothetical protein
MEVQMSWIDPEKIMTGLMKSMGVSPQDFVNFLQMTQREFAEMRADRLAFKPASVKAYQDVTARLERVEVRLEKILQILDPELTDLPATIKEFPNEQRDVNGH